jgi:hypothetical protein
LENKLKNSEAFKHKCEILKHWILHWSGNESIQEYFLKQAVLKGNNKILLGVCKNDVTCTIIF